MAVIIPPGYGQAVSTKPGDAGMPAGALRNHIGLNEGLAWEEEMTEKAAKIGVRLLRKDLGWKEVEPEKGRYDWEEIDRYLKAAEKHNIKVMLILGKTNKLYDPTPTIPLPGNFLWEPYAAYVRAAVERYKDRNIIWELWNEPDIPHMHADMTPVQFILNAMGVIEIIRDVDPDATIVGPGAGYALRLDGQNWSKQVLDNLRRRELLDAFWQNLNAWTGHQYTSQAPDRLMIEGQEMYALQRAVLDSYGGEVIPYCNGERGFTANPKASQAYAYVGNEDRQQDYYLRQCLWAIYREPRSFVVNYVTHDIYDSGKAIVGTATGAALSAMLDVLGDYEFQERLPLYDEDIVLLRFTRGAQSRYALWDRLDRSIQLNLPIAASQITVTDKEGAQETLPCDTYCPSVTVSGSPVFINPHHIE